MWINVLIAKYLVIICLQISNIQATEKCSKWFFLFCSSWSGAGAHLRSKAVITTDLFVILKTSSKVAFFFFFPEDPGSKVKQKQGKLIIHAAL